MVYLAPAGAQLRRAVINLFIVIPLTPGTEACAYSCLPDSKGLGPGGASPSIPAQCQRRWLPAQSQVSQSSEPRSWGGKEPLRKAHCFPEFSPHLSICPHACHSSHAPFQEQSHLPHCPMLETGPWQGHLICQPSKPGSHLVLSGQPPESLSNLFFHIYPDCPSLPGLAFILSCPGSCLSLPQALPAPSPSPPEGSF